MKVNEIDQFLQTFSSHRNLPVEIPRYWLTPDGLLAGDAGENVLIVNRVTYKCFQSFQNSYLEKHLHMENVNRITDNDFVSGLNTWYISINSVVHKSLNKFLLESLQHGIVDHAKKEILHDRNVPAGGEAKVLTIHILSAGFYVWLASIGIACVVFVLEHIHKLVTQLYYNA